jgi:hypothetical protein
VQQLLSSSSGAGSRGGDAEQDLGAGMDTAEGLLLEYRYALLEAFSEVFDIHLVPAEFDRLGQPCEQHQLSAPNNTML